MRSATEKTAWNERCFFVKPDGYDCVAWLPPRNDPDYERCDEAHVRRDLLRNNNARALEVQRAVVLDVSPVFVHEASQQDRTIFLKNGTSRVARDQPHFGVGAALHLEMSRDLPRTCVVEYSYPAAQEWAWLREQLSFTRDDVFFLRVASWVFGGFLLATLLTMLFNLLRGAARFIVVFANWLRTAGLSIQRADQLGPTDSSPVIGVVLSDLHLTAEHQAPFELSSRPSKWPTSTLPLGDEILRRAGVALTEATKRASVVIVAGDITDTGTAAEWAQSERLFASLAPSTKLLSIVGNHDVNLNPGKESIQQRVQRAHDNMVKLTPGFRHPVYFEDVGDVLVALVDSNQYRSKHVASNAIGLVGPVAIKELRDRLAKHSGPCVIVLHHHVAVGVGEALDYKDPDPLLRVVDATEVLECGAHHLRRNFDVLIVHGHRHVMLLGTVTYKGSTIKIAGMPSTTMGHGASLALDGLIRFGAITKSGKGELGFSIIQVPSGPQEGPVLSDEELGELEPAPLVIS